MVRIGTAVLAAVLAAVSVGSAAHADDPNAVMEQFFATWDQDATVTPRAVETLYAHRVLYYGQALTNGQVYANKLAFTRRWPTRRYTVVPGTVAKSCDGAMARCEVSVTLAYRARDDSRGATASGLTRVALLLSREDGQFKIVRESGRPVARP